MQEYKIEIKIDENGNIKAETFGIEGDICETELNEILKGLGNIVEDKKKPEYYKKGSVKIGNKQQIGGKK